MQAPLQIAFEHFDHSDALEAAVRKEAQRLERFHDRITARRAAHLAPIEALRHEQQPVSRVVP